MRTIKLIFIIPCLLFLFSACEKDNFTGPDATIQGAFTDAELGGPLSFSQNGGGGNIRFLVNDPAKYPIPSANDYALKQDGTYYNSFVFAENYKVFPSSGSGPWIYLGNGVLPTALVPNGKPDSLNVTINKGVNPPINFKVYPYFRLTISAVDTNITVNITRSVQAAFAGNQVTGSNDLIVYVNNYPLVNSGTSGNAAGRYYVNRWNFTINSTTTGVVWGPNGVGSSTTQSYTFGTPLLLPKDNIYGPPPAGSPPGTLGSILVYGIGWQATHWPKGTYYWRASIQGTIGSACWSNTVSDVIH